MENKNDNGAGCLIILVIIILIALGNMKDDHKKQTDKLQDEIPTVKSYQWGKANMKKYKLTEETKVINGIASFKFILTLYF